MKSFLLSILRRGAYVSCREYDGTSQSARNLTVKQGGTADLYKFVPDRIFDSVGDFLILDKLRRLQNES